MLQNARGNVICCLTVIKDISASITEYRCELSYLKNQDDKMDTIIQIQKTSDIMVTVSNGLRFVSAKVSKLRTLC